MPVKFSINMHAKVIPVPLDSDPTKVYWEWAKTATIPVTYEEGDVINRFDLGDENGTWMQFRVPRYTVYLDDGRTFVSESLVVLASDVTKMRKAQI